MGALTLVQAPAVEPITLDEAKAQCRVELDFAADDTLLESYIVAARRYCEGLQNRAYITQTWELAISAWPDRDFIRVPLPPLQSVEGVLYYDVDGAEHTLDAGDYIVDTRRQPGRIVLAHGKAWPSRLLRPANGIVIQFTAGYGDEAADVPQEIRHAMLLLIAHWYENREASVTGASAKVSTHIADGVRNLLGLDGVMAV